MDIIYILVLGFIIDYFLGDPSWLPHPIVLIGNFIKGVEAILRKLFPSTKSGETVAGFLLNFIVVVGTFLISLYLFKFLDGVNYWLGFFAKVYFTFQIFAAHSLKSESLRVYKYLKIGDMANSRKYLSWIVGRDTKELDETAITKAVVETVAENTSDGVIAPMMYMVIGGPALGFMYKAVNTLDSMVGYKNDKYINLGKCSAIVDDIFNFIPAILTGIGMIITAPLVGLDGKNAFKIFLRDRHNHASPNSGKPESATAGALNVQLAGDAYYFGKLYKKKTMGDNNRPIDCEDIVKTNKLMYATSVFTLVVFLVIRFLVVSNI